MGYDRDNKEVQEHLSRSLEILQTGGIILYPTDTVYGLGCDATNAEAVARIYQIKQRVETKAMLCLVNNVAMLERHINDIPDAAYDLIDYSNRPTTIVYDKARGVATNLIAQDGSLGIRVVQPGFANDLIYKLRKPLVSTSANVSGDPTPVNFESISDVVRNAVDYIVPLPTPSNVSPSMIIKISASGKFKILRK